MGFYEETFKKSCLVAFLMIVVGIVRRNDFRVTGSAFRDVPVHFPNLHFLFATNFECFRRLKMY